MAEVNRKAKKLPKQLFCIDLWNELQFFEMDYAKIKRGEDFSAWQSSFFAELHRTFAVSL